MNHLAALEAVAQDELSCLWHDLHEAQRSALNGWWSIKCDGLTERIKVLTVLVGPTPWDEIQIPLLENGVYQRIHSEIGIPVEVDMKKVAEVRASIDSRLSA